MSSYEKQLQKTQKKALILSKFLFRVFFQKNKKKHLEKTKKTKNIFRNSCIRGSLNHESLNMFLVVVLFFFFFLGGGLLEAFLAF